MDVDPGVSIEANGRLETYNKRNGVVSNKQLAHLHQVQWTNRTTSDQ
jgi:hypothetical protein